VVKQGKACDRSTPFTAGYRWQPAKEVPDGALGQALTPQPTEEPPKAQEQKKTENATVKPQALVVNHNLSI
jgi:hypothetical protein